MNIRYTDMLELISAFLPQDKVPLVVDFGCGNGQIGRGLNTRNIPNESFDIDFDKLCYCALNGLNVHYGNILSAPLEDESVDIFVCSEVLEHLTAEELPRALGEIDKVLLSGGFVIITVPERKDICLKGRFHKNYVSFDDLFSFFNSYELCDKRVVYKNVLSTANQNVSQ